MSEQRALYAASEYDHQAALFEWAERSQAAYPALAYMFATLNGVWLPKGLAKKMKHAGMKRGVPDVWLPVPAGRYVGMVFELKTPGNSTTPEQKIYLVHLAESGWRIGVFYDWEHAAAAIVDYLEGRT